MKYLNAFGGAALAAATVLLGLAGPAQAVKVYVTYTGTVASATDTTGLFGGGNTLGLTYTASYIFDFTFTVPPGGLGGAPYTDQANHHPVGASSVESRVYGGTYFGSISPLLSAEFKFNGVTVPLTGSYYGYISAYNGTAGYTNQDHAVYEALSPNTGLDNYFYNNKGGTVDGLPADIILTAFSHEKKDGDTSGGNFYWQGNSLELNPLLLEISTVPPGETPLPAALPLFATGLAGLGILAHRMRRKRTA